MKIGKLTQTKFGDYTFVDNKKDVLFVAHCDTVREDRHFQEVNLSGDRLIYNSQLDDRLGVYTVLDLLPKLGIYGDILLTENEECGASTAQYFETDKQYNWIVEFDRRGTDVVDYEYQFHNLLDKYWQVGLGTYSDISDLEHLGCKAFNIGVGYYGEHTQRCYMDISEYIEQIAIFTKFYKDNYGKHYHHEKINFKKYNWKDNIYNDPFNESIINHGQYADYMYYCDICACWYKQSETIIIREFENRPICPVCENELNYCNF